MDAQTRKEKFKLSWLRGDSCADMAVQFGISIKAVRAMRGRMKLAPRPTISKSLPPTKENIDRVQALIYRGMSDAEVGRKLGLTKALICGFRHRNKLVTIRLQGQFSPPSLYPRAIVLASSTDDRDDYPAINAYVPAPPRVKDAPTDQRYTCQWIDGAPRAHNFCGQPCAANKSWCPTHHSRVFTKTLAPARAGFPT